MASGIAFIAILVAVHGATAANVWHNPNRIAVNVLPSDAALPQQSLRKAQQNCQRSAILEFVEYQPSPWETEWREHASEYHEDVCKWMQKDTPNVEHWVQMAEQYNRTGPAKGTLAAFMESTFPRFIYRNVCRFNTFPRRLEIPIEPLVGHLRHPYWNTNCKYPGSPTEPVPVESRDYLIVNPIPEKTFQSMYPGRRYLFDLGTSHYNTSVGWFTARYGSQGIHFDEIWAWEVSLELAGNPYENYWQYIPEGMRPKMHFYNYPITSNVSAADFPMNIIRNIYIPGDFIVVKMDVEGNDVIEEGMLKPFLQEPGAASMVAEFFYELHFGKMIFNLADQVSLQDALQAFHKLRSMGLRLHYWP